MNRIDDAVYKSVTDDMYKLYPYGGSHVDHYAILGAAHIIADALDRLTEQMVIYNKTDGHDLFGL